MAKYAIKHADGVLLKDMGSPFFGLTGDFKEAMTFSSKKAAQNTADFINEATAKAGRKSKCYTVCEKKDYRTPDFMKKKSAKKTARVGGKAPIKRGRK